MGLGSFPSEIPFVVEVLSLPMVKYSFCAFKRLLFDLTQSIGNAMHAKEVQLIFLKLIIDF